MSKKLDDLRAELAKHFGKTTRWKVLCKERNATTEDEQIKLAEEVLTAWSTGTVAECRSHQLDLEGVKPMDLDARRGRLAAAGVTVQAFVLGYVQIRGKKGANHDDHGF